MMRLDAQTAACIAKVKRGGSTSLKRKFQGELQNPWLAGRRDRAEGG
jgi:hypothetical protein